MADRSLWSGQAEDEFEKQAEARLHMLIMPW